MVWFESLIVIELFDFDIRYEDMLVVICLIVSWVELNYLSRLCIVDVIE